MNKYNREEYILEDSPLKKDLLRLFDSSKEINILDIGGCEGEESLRYSRIFPYSKIFVFEPLPNNQEIIVQNIKQYNAKAIELVPKAVSDFDGITDFYVSSGQPETNEKFDWDFGNKSSSLLPPNMNKNHEWLVFRDKIQVETLTLQKFFVEKGITKVDFVHMDVQGAELKVLEGSQDSIKFIKAIWLEVADVEFYENQPLRREVEKFMKANRFNLVKSKMIGSVGDQLYLNQRFFSSFFIVRKFLLREKFNNLLR